MHRAFNRAAFSAAVLFVAALPAGAQQQKCPATTPGTNMPLTYKGGATVAPITACDLMTRLYIYAADSMMGREAGSPDALRATAYIEGEVRRLGLEPAGDKGTYYQYLPVTARYVDPTSSIVAGRSTFRVDKDFTTATADRSVTGEVVFAGAPDTSSALDVQGKIVIALPAPAGGRGGRGAGGGGGGGRGGFGGGGGAYAGAAAVITVSERITPSRPQYTLADTVQNEGRAEYARTHTDTTAGRGGGGRGGNAGRGAGGATGIAPPLAITATPSVAAALLGKAVASAKRGDKGASATITIRAKVEASPTRNVVGIIRGTDPVLRNEYIVIGAHSDHVGFARSATIEHDSLKAYNIVARTEGADSRGGPPPTEAQWARINAIKDSLRKIYPAHLDSISNGADDDGSGSVSILEIAEAFAKGNVKPKRSLIFIWQMGDEKGLWGSQYWTNHPTVPRENVVADLNMDMVGRGEATDVTGQALDTAAFRMRKSNPPAAGGGRGGLAQGLDTIPLHGAPNYVQLVGAGRLSTELRDIANQVNTTEKMPFVFDYSMDADSHPQNIYCRSDHANYARYNIPVIFFTTGGHADYHQVTDEPEYIRYEHMARVDQLVFDIAVKVGNLDHRVVVDKTKFDSPFGRCQQ